MAGKNAREMSNFERIGPWGRVRAAVRAAFTSSKARNPDSSTT